MISFLCQCGNKLYFENSHCLACGRKVGYLPDISLLSSLEHLEGNRYTALVNGLNYRTCTNYHTYEICNWMIPDSETGELCQSCRLTETIPNLSEPGNIKLWYRVEKAKRRLLYSLNQLGLPTNGRNINPESGLSFRFMADSPMYDEFSDEVLSDELVMTGHHHGTITINLAEADPSAREDIKERMNELYRTLLGHFRHESGHYYWDKLIRDTRWLAEFRDIFGSETLDYATALKKYYAEGPSPGWHLHWVSAYASVHPWEDFAETWAHYLHMVDSLETARNYGFTARRQDHSEPRTFVHFDVAYLAKNEIGELVQEWMQIADALNAMNRSMGLADAYPFVISEEVTKKMELIHRIVTSK